MVSVETENPKLQHFHSAAICSTVAVGLTGGFVLEHMSGQWALPDGAGCSSSRPSRRSCWAASHSSSSDGPGTARWLSPQQRHLIQADVARDSQTLPRQQASQVVARKSGGLGASRRLFLILAANTALSFFIPTILREAGFGGYRAIGNAIAALYSRRDRRHCVLDLRKPLWRLRYHCAMASLVSVASLMVLVFVWHSSRHATFVTLVLALAGTGAGISLFWQIPVRSCTARRRLWACR